MRQGFEAAVGMDAQGGMGHVGEGEAAHVLCHTVVGIGARAKPPLL